MKKTTLLNMIMVVGISATLLTGCQTSTESPALPSSTETVATAEPESTAEQAVGVVKTTAGLVQGIDNDGIYTYLGVPYAQATERFVPAGDVEPWDGIRMADTYGAMSPQGAILGMGINDDETGTDNNCQNLNIWTPGPSDGQKRPVMVWLHGGGFSMGTANEPMSDGKNLSQSGDVVVVSVNHRLNVFGHLDLSAYGEKYQYSGNVGVTDIVAALEWIQDNIAAFGGDPDNVTVFGQSGGGAKVLSLMTSPYAKGIFHKGIVQSGATETMGVKFSTKEESETLTEHILENLGVTPDNIEELQNVSTHDLQAAATEALQATANEYEIPAAFTADYAMEWGPVIDGDYMPTNPVTETGFADAGRDIPLLIGSNLNEWTIFVPASAHTEMTEAARNAYAQAYPNKDVAGAENVDTFIRLPMLKIMSHKADQGGAPVYAYVFTWENAERGSSHGAEIPFVFNNVSGGDADIQNLAETVSRAWINFARSGIPGAAGLPDWEPYTREQGATMLLDIQSVLVYHHDAELIRLLEPDYVYYMPNNLNVSTTEQPGTAENILIVYLSRTGNTEAVARMIQENVGGRLVSLGLENPYPEDYQELVAQVDQENETDYLPPLITSIQNIESYDTVFLGFPTWDMQLPPPMKSFLNRYNLSGKTVIPFNTNGGYGVGSSFRDVEERCQDCNVLEGFSVEGGSERDGILFVMEGDKEVEVKQQVRDWLDKLGIRSQ